MPPPVDDTAEPADAGAEHEVPAELVELHEVQEWQAAVDNPDAGVQVR